jgi:hypothetical protein
VGKNLGDAFMSQRQYPQAIKEAVRVDLNFAKAYLNLGNALLV